MPLDIEGVTPPDRPGYVEEYERIVAAREERGLASSGVDEDEFDDH